ncbi:MAG: RNA-binding S4 domain-containing protein [Bacillota bacterium]|nr:MAG: RNA-binding protein [Bacillota bacterium]
MRLDKFLKVSRLIKRRTLAKEVAESGRIQVNGRVAKPSTEVEPGDEIRIDFGRRQLVVRVVDVRESARAAEARELYEVVAETFVDSGLEHLEDDPE